MSECHQTMGDSDATSIVVRGYDLTDELIGRIDFTSMAYLEVKGRLPSAAETRMLDAVLVALTEHGMTPSAIATRLTQLGAPGSLQGAIAAGLLGVGDVFLGAVEEAGRLLQAIASGTGEVDARIADVVEAQHAAGRRIPGVGHPVHKDGDPRTTRLFGLAAELSIPDVHRGRMRRVQEITEEVYGRAPLPINVDGACAAVLCDLGLPWQVHRGFALIARCAGLVGHAWDELQHPAAPRIWELVERGVPYVAPNGHRDGRSDERA